MNKYNIFIDGQSGTTGLQILDRLKNHSQINIIGIEPENRKDQSIKEQIMSEVDLAFLCLPDEAARESALIARKVNCRVIDASSAHRCDNDWVYGLPELDNNQRMKIAEANLVANPGCYATGALLLLKPLIMSSVIGPDVAVHITGASGYSGGGNSMIHEYETSNKPSGFSLYGLNFLHKHIPEIQKWAGLKNRPIFFPSVINSKQGMLVLIALDANQLKCATSEVMKTIEEYYRTEQFIRTSQNTINKEDGFIHIEGIENSNFCDIAVYESKEERQVLLVAKLDNLGKGASGAAVQNMNIMLGLSESLGVEI